MGSRAAETAQRVQDGGHWLLLLLLLLRLLLRRRLQRLLTGLILDDVGVDNVAALAEPAVSGTSSAACRQAGSQLAAGAAPRAPAPRRLRRPGLHRAPPRAIGPCCGCTGAPAAPPSCPTQLSFRSCQDVLQARLEM